MNIKLIAMDMDGTLLQKDNTISPRTKKALMEAQKRGIRLVLASGRSYRKLMEYAQELDMARYGGYLIEVNGIGMYDLAKDERTVYAQFEQPEITTVFNYLRGKGAEVLGMKDDGIYDYIPESLMPLKAAYRKQHKLAEDVPWSAGAFSLVADNRSGYPDLHYIQDGSEIKETLNKFSVAHTEDVLAHIAEEIKQELAGKYWVGLTSPVWLEIMPKDVTKASGLNRLCEHIHISMKDVMAFGDGENDMEMLEAVGYGMVMGNALDNVKKIGYAICEDHDADGVAKAIETFILNAN